MSSSSVNWTVSAKVSLVRTGSSQCLFAVQEPKLDPLQEQILGLLGVPTSPYGAA
ncbi:MAG: hypothetical protein ACRD0S_01680 [Acidimicrobiales bacterium]